LRPLFRGEGPALRFGRRRGPGGLGRSGCGRGWGSAARRHLATASGQEQRKTQQKQA
jgi:hypothetical protein